nr:unnamed protein product [Macaca fascicularis]
MASCPLPVGPQVMWLQKCWPRNPTARLWIAGPSVSSPTYCSVDTPRSTKKRSLSFSRRSRRATMSLSLHSGMTFLSQLRTLFATCSRRIRMSGTPVRRP